MQLCPLLIIANKSFNSNWKASEKQSHCKGTACFWYDQREGKCKLINEIYKKEYVMKSFNFI